MTENRLSQARARFSRATVAVFAALVVLSTAGIGLDARHAAFVATDLGTLGQDGSTSEAFGVNNRGLVVGVSSLGSDPDVFHAFVWSEHMGLTDLGTLLGATQSTATAIISNGVILGFGPSGPDGPMRAFVRTHANGLLDLLTLGGSTTTPTAINAKGDVVGSSDIGDGTLHAFLWTKQDGIIQDLGTLSMKPGRTSNANAISDNGVVVGDSLTDDGPRHAFMWTHHNGMVDLETLGGLTSSAQGVSNEGVVVGNSQKESEEIHAFVWTRRTKMVDIGTDGESSLAEKINGRFVIGHFTRKGATHGFVWTQKRGLVDIGTLDGDTTSFVTGVNARGVVVGNSFVPGGPSHAFAWSASTRIVSLPTPDGRSSHANAITGDFIVGAICEADGVSNCQARLWKPSSPSHRGREHDDDDD
jgi:probable HAF family extracellular repeat protein